MAKGFQGLAEAIGQMYDRALGGLLSRDLSQANEAIRLSASLKKREQDLLRPILKEFPDMRGVLPMRGIHSGMAQIREYTRSIALIACNRYLETPSNLSRPAMASS